jgi:hypothetical protein
MPFTPVFANWAGMLPIQEAAKAIIEADFVDALAWRCALDGSTPGDAYARIQFTQRHSQQYPLLIIQPATDTPEPLGSGGIRQAHVFDCEIFLTRAISTGNLGDAIDDLARDLVRYYDATVMAFLSAPDSDWVAEFPAGSEAGKLQPWCTNAVFGQLQQSREVNGLYLHSVAFELQVNLIESE